MSPQNKVRVHVHFIWAIWDRLPLISSSIERRMYREIEAICAKKHCDVLALGGTEDHVHLLVNLSNTITIADLMEAVKGSSSHFANEELVPAGTFKWQGSYGAFSVSPHEKAKVINYINQQKEHHANGTIWPNAEKTEEPRERESQVPASAGTRLKAA